MFSRIIYALLFAALGCGTTGSQNDLSPVAGEYTVDSVWKATDGSVQVETQSWRISSYANQYLNDGDIPDSWMLEHCTDSCTGIAISTDGFFFPTPDGLSLIALTYFTDDSGVSKIRGAVTTEKLQSDSSWRKEIRVFSGTLTKRIE
jgi:hypothetical protein